MTSEGDRIDSFLYDLNVLDPTTPTLGNNPYSPESLSILKALRDDLALWTNAQFQQDSSTPMFLSQMEAPNEMGQNPPATSGVWSNELKTSVALNNIGFLETNSTIFGII